MTHHDASTFEVRIAEHATALTIAGSDPSGGAGLQADLKTFHELGVYGMAVVTLTTIQNTIAVRDIDIAPCQWVLGQLDAVLSDIPPRVIKTGALGSAETIRAVASTLRQTDCPLVADPVLISKHGDRLADDEAVDAYRETLLPLATIATPNRFEAEQITGVKDDPFAQAEALAKLGVRYPLIKAGESDGERLHVLRLDDELLRISVPSLPQGRGHGAGCCLSACITGWLAARAEMPPTANDIREACHFAIRAVHQAMSVGPKYGQGESPIEMRILRHGEQL